MENETNNQSAPTGGLKLMTVFIVVLALHVFVIGGIGAYTLLKGNNNTENTVSNEPAIAASEEKMAPAAEVKSATESTVPAATETPVIHTTPVEEVAQKAAVQAKALTEKPVETVALNPESGVEAKVAGIYTVKAGDTLTKVARIHQMRLSELRAMNQLTSDQLKVGQKLKVGSGSAPAAKQEVVESKPAPVTKPVAAVNPEASAKKILSRTSVAYYTVGKGDTLSKIARQFKTTPSAIMAANKLTDANKLKIGMKLSIPNVIHQEASDQIEHGTPIRNQEAENAEMVMR